MVLERILARTRADLALRKREVPLGRLLTLGAPGRRSLSAALRRPRTGFILECKRASPSEGTIREAYDPAAIAAAYAEHADAVSVLTDQPFFHGSLDHLDQVREAVTLPVLRKDFVVDPYQVAEAAAHGADAVLLMLSVLDDAEYRDCAAAAGDVGVEALTEVHTDAELDRALALGAGSIGINNRDLRTLRVDLETTRRLAPRVPAGRVVVCESGVHRHADVLALAPLVDAFLVGTALMREADVGAGVRRLIYGVTKVCGLTRAEDARAAWQAGALYGGLIFAPESPRRVDRERAGALVGAAPLRWVGVFVNQPAADVAALARDLGLAAVQLHGDETPQKVAALRSLLPPRCEVWKAVRVRDRIPALGDTGADRMVLDTWRAGQRGGTGERFDWRLLAGNPDRDNILLGGGLTPAVAAEAGLVGAWGLDVNSGVETAPGIKSAERIHAFLAARRGPGRRAPTS